MPESMKRKVSEKEGKALAFSRVFSVIVLPRERGAAFGGLSSYVRGACLRS